jgi:hypothetical protein
VSNEKIMAEGDNGERQGPRLQRYSCYGVEFGIGCEGIAKPLHLGTDKEIVTWGRSGCLSMKNDHSYVELLTPAKAFPPQFDIKARSD